MDTKALRQKILDLAIRGKLVPQDPNDEPASVLLERIRAQKQQMVQEGKLKAKDIKNDSIIYIGEDNLPYEKFADGSVKCITDEVPFEIPEGWAWSRGYCCFEGMKSTKPQGKYFYYIDIDSIDNKLHKVIQPKKMPTADAPSRASRALKNGSVLFSLVRPYLENIALVFPDLSHCIASTGFYVCNSTGTHLPKFLFNLMTSNYVIAGLNQFMKGDNSPSISKDNIEHWLYPVPPLAEQKRIAEKIDELLSLVEKISVEKNELNNLSFAVKSKCLDHAIRGKLVPQDPNDEPASVLLERIREEKSKLITEGKIKKDNHESIIFRRANSHYEKFADGSVKCIDEEIPFEIPESWTWCRLSHIFSFVNGDRGKNYPSKSKLSTTGIPFISALNLNGETVVFDDNLLHMTEEQYNKLGNGKLMKGDVIVCIRGSLGKHGRYPFENGAIASSLVILRCVLQDEEIFKYIMLWLDTPLFFTEIKKYDNGTAQPNLASKSLEQFFVPVPPLAEQRRIVEKIDSILPLLKTL